MRLRPFKLTVRLARAAALGLGLLGAACLQPAETFEATLGAVVADCPAGLNNDGAGCVEREPANCPAGTSAFAGETGCSPVGAVCDAGFLTHPSGWGCVEAFAASPCTGATREAPGAAACVPIGDCGAPFPPAGATHFVDAAFTAAQLDATHFQSIRAAVIAAGAGAVIAVEAGSYAEPIIDPLDPMTIAGRCAEKVRVGGTGGNQVALYVPGTKNVVVRGLTLTGHAGGVFADTGGLLIEDSVIEGNVMMGLFAKNGANVTVRRSRISGARYAAGGELGAGVVANTGSTVVLEDVAVTGNDHRGLSVGGLGSTLRASGCYVGRQRLAAVAGRPAGVLAVDRASLELERCAIADNDGVGVHVAAATASLRQVTVRAPRGNVASATGIGVYAEGGASVTISDCTVADSPVMGLYADGAGTEVKLSDSTVRGFDSLVGVEMGRGAQIAGNARLDATRSAFVNLSSAGVAFQQGGTGRLDRVRVSEVREIAWPDKAMLYGGFGVLCEDQCEAQLTAVTVERATLSAFSAAYGSTVTLDRGLARDTMTSTASGTGCAAQVIRASQLSVSRSKFAGNRTAAVMVASTASLFLVDSVVTDTLAAADGSFGNGINLFEKSTASLRNVAIARSAGIGLIADDGNTRVTGGTLEENGVALHVQDGSYLSDSDDAAALKPGEVRVSSTTSFLRNRTRVGSGVVPLPRL